MSGFYRHRCLRHSYLANCRPHAFSGRVSFSFEVASRPPCSSRLARGAGRQRQARQVSASVGMHVRLASTCASARGLVTPHARHVRRGLGHPAPPCARPPSAAAARSLAVVPARRRRRPQAQPGNQVPNRQKTGATAERGCSHTSAACVSARQRCPRTRTHTLAMSE